MSALWDWAVAAYARPGVEDACLQLQDTAGQNVPLLLWAAWAASQGRRADAETLEAAADTARAWETAAIGPLRAVRRALKVRLPDLEPDDRLAVRAQVKAVELDAERRLLLALEVISPPGSGAARPALDALAEAARAWAPTVPRAMLSALAEHLPA